MTGTAPQIEWYIGRDGQRHGPISDDEMRKFVELGHLRPTDLVWCQTFTEWKPASQVFPRGQPPAGSPAAAIQQPVAPAQSASVTPASATSTSPVQTPAAGQQPAAQQSFARPSVSTAVTPASVAQSTALAQSATQVNPTPSPTVVPNPAAPIAKQTHPSPTSPQAGSPQAGSPQAASTQAAPAASSSAPSSPASALNEDAAWAEAMRSVLQPTTPQSASGPGPYRTPAAASDFGAARPNSPIDTSPQPVPSPRLGHADPSWEAAPAVAADDFEPPRKRRDWIAVTAGAVAVVLVICGLAWIAWQNRSLVSGASAIGSAIKATVSTTPSADSFRLSPYDAPGETRDAIDAALQRTAIWRILKRDHPQWYAERVGDIEQRRGQKMDEKAISKFMADVIVTLRRNNALAALQSSPEHMRQMARTFGENLRQLASRDGSTCFAFITFGEGNPYSQDLARTPAFAETLQRQMVAIFEAIANGKAQRQIHPNTRRNDYDLLTKELTNRGWSQNDLALFSDPSRLSASPPEKVCTLVQEWFATHLALTDADLQARLLAESLKPLVGG